MPTSCYRGSAGHGARRPAAGVAAAARDRVVGAARRKCYHISVIRRSRHPLGGYDGQEVLADGPARAGAVDAGRGRRTGGLDRPRRTSARPRPELTATQARRPRAPASRSRSPDSRRIPSRSRARRTRRSCCRAMSSSWTPGCRSCRTSPPASSWPTRACRRSRCGGGVSRRADGAHRPGQGQPAAYRRSQHRAVHVRRAVPGRRVSGRGDRTGRAVHRTRPPRRESPRVPATMGRRSRRAARAHAHDRRGDHPRRWRRESEADLPVARRRRSFAASTRASS